MPSKKDAQLKPGDKVETVHGEKLVVLAVKTSPEVTDKGVVIRESKTFILAESGNHQCWFPAEKIKA